MNKSISKVSLTFLIASVAFILPGCENEDGDLQRNLTEKGLPSFAGSIGRNAVSFMIGDVGYLGAAYSAKTDAGAKGFWAYDTKTKLWAQVADFPTNGQKHATVSKGKAYIVADKLKSDRWEYNPITNSWTK